MKNNILKTVLCVSALLISAGAAQAQQGPDDCDKLKKDYDSVLADRDNLLSQIKLMVDFKSKYLEIQEANKKAVDAKAALEQDARIKDSQLADLRQKLSDLELANNQLVKEKEDLKKSLEKMSFEYRIVPEIKKELAAAKSESSSLARSVKQLESRVKKAQEEKINNDAQQEIYRMQIKEMKKRYEQALTRNRKLEKKAEQLPVRFAEISRENKTLIKETALMHYNLGVFYTKNKEYTRAFAEFEKSAELNPDDAASFFNLGYICAEYLVNRPKAIEYFRKFLSLAKTGDKDVDWVKKYILTWQTWEGKKPLE